MKMKKTLALVMFLCIALGAQAQLLWKISGNGLNRPSYVMGTHHLAPLSIKDSISSLKQAMDETQQIYGEVIMEDMMKPEIIMKMQQAMMLPADTTLKSLYTPAEYDSIASVVKTYIGMDLSLFDKLKPASLTTQLAVAITAKSIKGFNPQEQLDTWFQTQAKEDGKKVGGLESMDKQINVLFNAQNLQRQARLLYCAATNIEHGILQTQRMTKAYMNQDLDTLLEIMEEKQNDSCDSTPEEEDILIFGRNADWVRQMPDIMKQAPTLFVVGAGHLPSERGLLKLLEKQGYTIEAMK